MKRGEITIEPIPTDLIIEVFSRLPSKSVAKLRSLSKQWGSILRDPGFTDLYLSRSSTRPRLLFATKRSRDWLFFSCPQNPHEKSVIVDYHTKFSEIGARFSYASGLIYIDYLDRVINPITGMYVNLPEPWKYRKSHGHLGFDPIDKRFKVVTEAFPFCSERDHHNVLTLGPGELSWRNDFVSCPGYNRSLNYGKCINGVLYFLVVTRHDSYVIVCFDLNTEVFKIVDAKCIDAERDCDVPLNWINYKGKLGAVYRKYDYEGDGSSRRRMAELCIWVLEDAEKGEWFKYTHALPENELLDSCGVYFAGTTARGEIVMSMSRNTGKPFYVFYFNPERNTIQSVEIKGFGDPVWDGDVVYCFVDYVEELCVDDAQQLKSSIYAPQPPKPTRRR